MSTESNLEKTCSQVKDQTLKYIVLRVQAMKRILIISPIPTHPHTAGNRARVCMILSSLKKMGYDVHFLHIENERGDTEKMKKAWGESFHAVDYHRPRINRMRRLIKKLRTYFNSESRYIYNADDWWDNSVNPFIKKLHAKFKYDVVIVEYIFFSKALEFFDSKVTKIIDTHDIFSNRHKLFLQKNIKPTWFSTTEKEERKALNRADIVIAIQDKEEEFFKKMTEKLVVRIGHPVSILPPAEHKMACKILYLASQNTMNLESINWFIEKVFVLIKQKIPDAELLVAGRICEGLLESEGIVKLGVLDNLNLAYNQANVVINPVLCGTGLKIKNIEALGYSKALVTTPLGAEGLEDVAGEVFLVGEGAASFAAHVMEVLLDKKLNKSLEYRAFNFAKNWNKKIISSLKEAIES
jgi:hypothetical protein